MGQTKLVNAIAQKQTTLIMRNHHDVAVNADNNKEIKSNAFPVNSYDHFPILRLITATPFTSKCTNNLTNVRRVEVNVDGPIISSVLL